VIAVEIKQGETDGGGAVDGFDLGVLAFGFAGLGEDGLAVELLLGEVAEEDDDAIFGGVALDAQPDVEGLGIEGFELSGHAVVHGAAVDVDVGRAFVDGVGEDFVEIAAAEVLPHGDDFVGAAIQVDEVVVAIEKDDGVRSRVEELLHLPAEGIGWEIGACGEV
jgi:hypothetical protein